MSSEAIPTEPVLQETAQHGLHPADAREFTFPAVLVGLLVAAVIGASYPYIVLKLGFGPNISVVSAFFGYFLLGLISLAARRFVSNRWQNNMVQTAGTAAGQTAFLCVIMAAFDVLSREPGLGISMSLSPIQTFAWLTTAGLLGVLLAVPLRRHYIIEEHLTFADGVAAGETLIVLDSKGTTAKRVGSAMVWGLVISAFTMLAGYFKKIAEAIPVTLNRFSGVTGVGVSLSWLNLGSGMIVGMRINTSMLIGLIASWVIAPPLLFQNRIITAAANKNEILLWVMWPATGMLVAGGLAALFLKWHILMKTFKSFSGSQVEHSDFPLAWVGIGAAVTGTALILVQHFILHIPTWETLVAIIFTIPLMMVGLRVLGETNWGPISALSNLMQGVFGFLSPGNVKANMVASGVTGSVATESEGIMQVYKTGHMIGSTPRYLTYMQLLAVPVGAAAVSYMYPLLRATYGVCDPNRPDSLQSPISMKWVGFAKLLAQGISHLHPSAVYALLIGSALGILFTVLEQRDDLRSWVPSPTGLGIGMLVPAGAVATMFLGGLVEMVWRRWSPQSASKYLIAVASGFIAGEAIIAVVLPILIAIGLLKP